MEVFAISENAGGTAAGFVADGDTNACVADIPKGTMGQVGDLGTNITLNGSLEKSENKVAPGK